MRGDDVVFRLENDKWGPCPANAFGQWRDNAGVLMKPGEFIRLCDEHHSRVVNLGHGMDKLDEDHLRDTGTMIHTTKKRGAGNTVINIVWTTIQRPAVTGNRAERMNSSTKTYVASCLISGLIVSGSLAAGESSFDPAKAFKDYAGKTIIGSKSSANGRSDSVIAGEHAQNCADLLLRHCTGLQVQVYPAFQGSWPDAAPETIEKMTFKTEGLSALVNWGLDHQQKTLHHLMIGPNQYFPEWFWKNTYTAEELDQLLKRYITTLMTANDNKRKMDGWNIFNEMLMPKEEAGVYKKDGPERGGCVWMRMGFEADQSGLMGKAKINEQHPVVFRKALQYASMASGQLEIREPRVEEINRKSDALYQLIKHLLNSGVRVDAVGFQGHLNVNRSYDWDSVKKNIRRFKDLGLEVYITELDVSMGMEWKKGDPFPADYEKRQTERYYGLVKAAREAGVNRIDVWGLSEAVNQHWLVGQKARLFDEQFKPRATYQAVLKALYDSQLKTP